MTCGSWLKPHLLDKGPLLALYHTWGDGHEYPGEQWESQFGCNPDMMAGNWWGHAPHERYDMISEGDSPSFLYLIDKGLRSLEDPTFGGWGGRFVRNRDNEFNTAADYWCSATDACEPSMKPEAWQITRWAADWLSDFASRASWCVTPRYEDANHAPGVTITEGLDLVAAPGETLVLHAATSDPDGDAVHLSWFRYADADTCAADVPLCAEGALCELTVPDDACPGDTIHLVCRASDEDNGRDTYMVSYARVIITVASSVADELLGRDSKATSAHSE